MKELNGIAGLMGYLKSEAQTKAKLCGVIAVAMKAKGLPTNEPVLWAFRVGLAAMVLDVIEELPADDPARVLLEEHAREAIASVQAESGVDLNQHIEEARAEGKQKAARINEGDDILGGIDFNAE